MLTTLESVLKVGQSSIAFAQELAKFKQTLTGADAPRAFEAPGTEDERPRWAMPSFRGRARDPFHGGTQWIPQLEQVAARFGDPWVPPSTAAFMGVDLTGVWAPPLNPADQTYLRQYGPYVNIVVGVGGVPTGFGEGVFDPRSGLLLLQGVYATGAPFRARAQVLPNWTMQGQLETFNPYGSAFQLPLFMTRMA